MIWRFIITMALFLTALAACSYLTGCASTTWSAGLDTSNIDFKQPVDAIPTAKFSIGGQF